MQGIFSYLCGYIMYTLRMQTERKILNTSDIQRILDVSQRTAQRRMKCLKYNLGKQKHHLITLDEFLQYYRVYI
jgi:hypothetical protein